MTDPFSSSMVGLKFPKTEATIVTVSHEHDDHNNVPAVSGSPYVVRGPGEYEIQGVSIVGIPSFHDDVNGSKRGKNTIYRIEIDGVVVTHLGDLGHALTTQQVDALDGVDVLLVPVGGVYTIDANQAVSVINGLDPKIVIPMHYHRPALNQQVFGTLMPVAAFTKEMGKEEVVPVSKLSISRDKLPTELHVVVLE